MAGNGEERKDQHLRIVPIGLVYLGIPLKVFAMQIGSLVIVQQYRLWGEMRTAHPGNRKSVQS